MMQQSRLLSTNITGSLAFIFISISIACHTAADSNERWKAPADAQQLINPLSDHEASVKKGEAIYNLYCRSCHGETGLGDGPARGPLGQRPANFHGEKVREQTNGELYWKISTGRNDMPAFKELLSNEQRWQLVSFIRNIHKKADARTPVALRADIKVAHFMKVDSQAVRILQNLQTGDLWYTTFNGNVFRVKHRDSGKQVSEKILSAQDHGIAILQGAAFLNNTLFLCGNVYSPNKKTTWGRMVRYNLDSPKIQQMSVVFNTAEYAANKTIYDHGWNALTISPDGKYVFVNSGARTDHGEVQDNGGEYPNARDNALTAKVFRFPSDARDLVLPDDAARLKADGYLFAQGIRNAFDICFDADGHLFGVSNSADYDYPEDMFWIRQDHHYGFPWVMGGMENPQQYKDWKPDPDTDPFINRATHSWETKYYYNDSSFPARPPGVKFSAGILNLGPDANEYRGHSGKIQDGDETGVALSTFTAHSCPLGLFFDTGKTLSGDLNGDGFMLRYTLGERSSLMRPFTKHGADLLHLELTYSEATDNYFVKTRRVVEGFKDPVDAVMVGNDVYIIEYGGSGGNIWKITLPATGKAAKKR